MSAGLEAFASEDDLAWAAPAEGGGEDLPPMDPAPQAEDGDAEDLHDLLISRDGDADEAPGEDVGDPPQEPQEADLGEESGLGWLRDDSAGQADDGEPAAEESDPASEQVVRDAAPAPPGEPEEADALPGLDVGANDAAEGDGGVESPAAPSPPGAPSSSAADPPSDAPPAQDARSSPEAAMQPDSAPAEPQGAVEEPDGAAEEPRGAAGGSDGVAEEPNDIAATGEPGAAEEPEDTAAAQPHAEPAGAAPSSGKPGGSSAGGGDSPAKEDDNLLAILGFGSGKAPADSPPAASAPQASPAPESPARQSPTAPAPTASESPRIASGARKAGSKGSSGRSSRAAAAAAAAGHGASPRLSGKSGPGALNAEASQSSVGTSTFFGGAEDITDIYRTLRSSGGWQPVPERAQGTVRKGMSRLGLLGSAPAPAAHEAALPENIELDSDIIPSDKAESEKEIPRGLDSARRRRMYADVGKSPHRPHEPTFDSTQYSEPVVLTSDTSRRPASARVKTKKANDVLRGISMPFLPHFTPGPGAYDVTGRTRFGMPSKVATKFTTSGRILDKELSQFNESPGPIYKHTHPEAIAVHRTCPRFAFGSDAKGARYSVKRTVMYNRFSNGPMYNPGPAYGQDMGRTGSKLLHGPRFTMPKSAHTAPHESVSGTRYLGPGHERENLGVHSPGPGTYQVPERPNTSLHEGSVAFTMRPKGQPQMDADVARLASSSPGPKYMHQVHYKKLDRPLGQNERHRYTFGKGQLRDRPYERLSASVYISEHHSAVSNYGLHSPGPKYNPDKSQRAVPPPHVPSPAFSMSGPLDRFYTRAQPGRM
ncbi:unnamed protein product [Pedinophyceae sp. YPF-701]|nr:unnamed protein product [Pedinophyceae sp. YPF-701]